MYPVNLWAAFRIWQYIHIHADTSTSTFFALTTCMFKPNAIDTPCCPPYLSEALIPWWIHSSLASALFHPTTTGSDVCQYVVTANNVYWCMVVNLSFGNANSIPGDDARWRNILPWSAEVAPSARHLIISLNGLGNEYVSFNPLVADDAWCSKFISALLSR